MDESPQSAEQNASPAACRTSQHDASDKTDRVPAHCPALWRTSAIKTHMIEDFARCALREPATRSRKGPSAAFAPPPKSQKQVAIPAQLPWPNRSRCAQAFGKLGRSTSESVYGECTVNIATKTAMPMTCSRKRRKATPTIVRTPSSVRRTESGRPRVSIPQTQLQ